MAQDITFSKHGTIVLNDTPRKFNLIAVGDVIPSGQSEKYFITQNLGNILGGTKELFLSADYVLFNLETPLCNCDAPINKCGPNFRTVPETVNGLKFNNFNIAALANNHILDFGKKGVEETLKALDDAKILRHGAGTSFEEATRPLESSVNGVPLTFLNYAEGEFSKSEKNQAGAAPIDLIHNKAQIENAKEKNKFVIVSAHAGKEYLHFPSPWLQDIYRKYISFGADLVIGHHPHIPQGFESYKNGIIFYSLGDFMFDYLEDHGTRVTYALDIQFGESKINSIKIHPIRKRNDSLMEFLEKGERELFIRHMNRISRPLKNPKELKSLYEQSVIRHFEAFYYPYLKKNIDIILSNQYRKKIAATFLFNMFDCPSHREALKTVFQLIYKGEYKKHNSIDEYLTLLNNVLEILGSQNSIEPYEAKGFYFRQIEGYLRQISKFLLKLFNKRD